MIIQALQQFLAANTQRNPKTGLPPGIGVDARNVDVLHGDLRGLKSSPSVHTLTGIASQMISLYRFGRDTPSDANYWILRSVDANFVRSLIAEDTTEKTYATDGTKPYYFDTSTLGGSEPYPTSVVWLGVPAPGSAMAAAIQVVGVGTQQETRSYLDTFIRANGDESAPNPNVTSITCKTDATIRLSSFAANPGGSYAITKRRIYVSVDGSEYQRCAEITTGTATFDDNGTVRGLVLQTGGSAVHPAWLTPPDNLVGLIALWNGMIGGHVGKSLRICEIDHPHAWPIEYEEVIPDTIVGTATFGSTWVICTTGQAYVAAGSTPLGVRSQRTNFMQACVAKRSVASVGHGVCWASNDGLCYFGSQGARVITEDFLDVDQWRALVPSSIIGVCWKRWYIGFYFDGTNRKGFMIDTLNPQGVVWLDQGAYGVFYDTVSEQIFMLGAYVPGSPTGTIPVLKWATGSLSLVTFKGSKTRVQSEVCPGAAMVVATTYPVTYKLWGDGVLRLTKTVVDETPFRLPGGYRARDFQQEVSNATGPVEGVVLAEEIADMP